MLIGRKFRAKWLALRSGGKIEIGAGSRIDGGANVTVRKGSILIGRNTFIGDGVNLVAQDGSIQIGDNCNVNYYSVLYGNGGLTIGNYVIVAPHAVFAPSNHKFADLSQPIALQGGDRIGIVVEDDVWIGAQVTVLAGAHISTGCVIAAGAVVRGKTEPFGVYGGVPAKLLKMRQAAEPG